MSDDPYCCPICERQYVVVSLVEDCLTRHEVETRPTIKESDPALR